MGIASVLDRAGPALATGIVLALLTGATTIVVAWRDLTAASAVRFGSVTTDLDRHWKRMDALDDRLRQQEQRPPRLNPALDEAMKDVHDIETRVTVLEQTVAHIRVEQERLCQRLLACKGNSK